MNIDSWYGQDDMADSKRVAKGLILQLAVAVELVLLALTLLATVQAEEHEISKTPAAAMAQASLPTLTTANAAHSLLPDQAKLGYPVHLHAVVTYYDPDTAPTVGALFACDQSGCICVLVPPRPVLPLRAGTVIDMKGVSKPGNYAPIVIASEVHAVGQSHLPSTAPRRSLAQLMTGDDDGQWVEVEGVIHSVAQSGAHITLALALADGEIRAITTREAGADYARLVDSTVVIRGNTAPVWTRNRQMVGARLLFPSMAQLRVEEPARADPFHCQRGLLIPCYGSSRGSRLSIVFACGGKSHLQWPGRWIYIQDGNQGLFIPTFQKTPTGWGKWLMWWASPRWASIR